jgi:hypothetical protein
MSILLPQRRWQEVQPRGEAFDACADPLHSFSYLLKMRDMYDLEQGRSYRTGHHTH